MPRFSGALGYTRLVLETIRGERTINEIASENNIPPNMRSRWKRLAESQMYTLFQDNSAKERKAQKDQEAQINELYTQIDRRTTQNEWLKKIWSLSCLSLRGGCSLTWMERIFLVSVQTGLPGLNRTGLYYRPAPPSEDDLVIKLHIDKIYTAHSGYGYRRICW